MYFGCFAQTECSKISSSTSRKTTDFSRTVSVLVIRSEVVLETLVFFFSFNRLTRLADYEVCINTRGFETKEFKMDGTCKRTG
jgi:hypothetical protein